MYHDTIHIIFHSLPTSINFEYNFLISKSAWLPNHNPIIYQDFLNKMENIGFNIDYLNFPDIKDRNINVYCSYNLTPNFNIFFKAYDRILKPEGFNISFEYGSMINGKFYPNNMNFYSSIKFERASGSLLVYYQKVIEGVNYIKTNESYQIVDKTGKIVDSVTISAHLNEEQSKMLREGFFTSRKVTQYLRKYKLKELMDK